MCRRICAVACVHAGVHAPVCMSVLKTDVEIRCLPQSFTAIFFDFEEEESLAELKAANSARTAVNKPQDSSCPHLS